MPKPPAGSPASATPAEQVDRDLAREALRKKQAGLQPSAREAAALRRIQKAEDERRRWEHYSSIPQKHWIAMSGRQAKIINEQAALYGLPFAGATIDLPAVVRAFHELLAEHGRKILKSDDIETDPDTALKVIKTKRQQFFYEQDLGNWISKEDVHEGMEIFAEAIRGASERLQRDYGPDAQRVLEEAFLGAVRKLDAHFATDDEPNPLAATAPPPPESP
jgi:hypothetical protein